jgi:hypothetical protein
MKSTTSLKVIRWYDDIREVRRHAKKTTQRRRLRDERRRINKAIRREGKNEIINQITEV